MIGGMETVTSPTIQGLRSKFYWRLVTSLVVLAILGCIASAVLGSSDPRPAPPLTARTPTTQIGPAQGSN